MVEGVRAVREVLDAGAQVRFAVVSPRLEGAPEGHGLRSRLEAGGSDVEAVSDEALEAAADTEHPQGVLLVCAEPSAGEEMVSAGGRFLVLDALQDPGNVGTLVRSAAAFGLDAVLALDGTADPWSPKTVRASAGTCFRTTVMGLSAARALELLGEAGVPLFVSDAVGRDATTVRAGASWALAVGNEGAGCRDTIREAATATVRVPMGGGVESLNAGVAGSILMYALRRGSDDG